MNAGLLIIILLLGLALLGFPIYIALGIGALAALNLADLPLIVLPQRMFAGMNGSALLAIPFFILAGNIMSRSITGKLIDICNAIIGHIKGSLSLVTILASALFGAISGSGVATASAIGGITIPAMKREGYPAPFAVGVASISSILGPIIPPSIVLIVYASITNVSVAELFLGSVLPGIILAVALIAYGLYYGHKHNLPAHEKPNLRKIGASVRKGIWALLMHIIILGGIFGGIFTPTEASAVAVVYSLIISLFVYKDMSFKELPQVFVEGAVSTATIMVMVGLSPSVVRACIMQIFLLTAPLFRRSSDGLTALAAALGVKCYDSELINETAKASGFATSFVETHEEQRPGSFLYSLVTGGGVIADDQPFPVQIFQAQSEVIRTIAARESCVIVGRCADYVLRDDPNAVLVNLFVHAPMAARIRRESARTNTTPAEAEKRIRQVDKERAAYYNFFSSKRWGDAQGYDLCVNTDGLEISDVAKLVLRYLELRGLR